MALDSGYWEIGHKNMSTDDVAALLVKLYGEYVDSCSNKFDNNEDENDDYARAVAIAIRMLSDE